MRTIETKESESSRFAHGHGTASSRRGWASIACEMFVKCTLNLVHRITLWRVIGARQMMLFWTIIGELGREVFECQVLPAD